MTKNDQEPKYTRTKLTAFTTNKPLWAFWTIYIAISGALFGVFYGVVRIVSYRWWIAPIIIIAGGIIWGTVSYLAMKKTQHSKEAP